MVKSRIQSSHYLAQWLKDAWLSPYQHFYCLSGLVSTSMCLQRKLWEVLMHQRTLSAQKIHGPVSLSPNCHKKPEPTYPPKEEVKKQGGTLWQFWAALSLDSACLATVQAGLWNKNWVESNRIANMRVQWLSYSSQMCIRKCYGRTKLKVCFCF